MHSYLTGDLGIQHYERVWQTYSEYKKTFRARAVGGSRAKHAVPREDNLQRSLRSHITQTVAAASSWNPVLLDGHDVYAQAADLLFQAQELLHGTTKASRA